MEHEPGPPDPEIGTAEARVSDPDGQASFLHAVRSLVHGAGVPPQRTGSDDWAEDAGGANAESAGDRAGTWLPGNWVAEPAPPRPGRRRRAAVSEKSAKSSRRRRRGRTVDEAPRGAGAEVQMRGHRRAPADVATGDATLEADPLVAPELEHAPEPPLSRKERRRDRAHESTRELDLHPELRAGSARSDRRRAATAERAERAAAKARLRQERKASREAAAAERAVTKARAAKRRYDAKEQAVLERAAALAAKTRARMERDAAKARKKARRQAEREDARAAKAALRASRKAAHAPVPDSPALAPGGDVAVPGTSAAAEALDRSTEADGRADFKADARADAKAAKARAKADQRKARAQDRAARDAERSRSAAEQAAAAPAERERAASAAAEADARERRAATQARAEAHRRAAEEKAQQQAAKEQAAAARSVEKTRVRAERNAATAARRRDRADSRAAVEQARVDRLAEEALASVARAKDRATATTARADAKADAKVAQATARARARAQRVAARAERRLSRAAAKAQKQVDRATARVQTRADVAAEHARTASALDAQVAAIDADVVPTRRAESLADYIARVESQRGSEGRSSRLTTSVKVALVTAVVAACALLPWAAPSVPQKLADLVPGHSTATRVVDPPIEPPTTSVAPEVVTQQATGLNGVRLQAAGPPREVSVPRLHVDSQVVPISGQSGSLLPPSDPQQLGWWREGQPAGAQYGSAVVTGHTVHTGGGALDHLDKLVVGDSVRVRTDAGWIRYVVERTQIYSTAQLARDAEQIFTHGGPGRLVLITCDDWNGSFYESNAVVFAAPVADEPAAGAGR